jgi:hypothetical protein
MKTVILLLAALLLIKTSSAFGNEACQKGYVGCVEACVNARHSQEPCIEKCQARNTACYSSAFGGQPAAPQEVQRPHAPTDANAESNENKPAGKTTAPKKSSGTKNKTSKTNDRRPRS